MHCIAHNLHVTNYSLCSNSMVYVIALMSHLKNIVHIIPLDPEPRKTWILAVLANDDI